MAAFLGHSSLTPSPGSTLISPWLCLQGPPLGPLPIPISLGTTPTLFLLGAYGTISLQHRPGTWSCTPQSLGPLAHPDHGMSISPTIRTQPNSDPPHPVQPPPAATPLLSPSLFSPQNSCQLMALLCSGPCIAPHLPHLSSPANELTSGPLYMLFLPHGPPLPLGGKDPSPAPSLLTPPSCSGASWPLLTPSTWLTQRCFFVFLYSP